MKMPFKIRAPSFKTPSFKTPSFKLPSFKLPSFDAEAINETIRSKLAAAGLDTTAGPMQGVTDTIRRALASASTRPTQRVVAANENVIDVVARAVDDAPGAQLRRQSANVQSLPVGTFERHEYANRTAALAYKLYVPAQIALSPPLIVMLHGCTQSADDFAAGTRMNRLADQHGFLVAYPEQTNSANPSKCWNWFKTQDQVRDCGEPALIAGITQVVAARYNVDRRRIFVAGMSAGAAMAVILGETYPDVFAAVGAHSGLPYRSANDIPSAMMAMKGGRATLPGLRPKRGSEGLKLTNLAGQATQQTHLAHAVPTIVFHGDRDLTVQHSNGVEIVRQAENALNLLAGQLELSTERGTCVNGRSYTRTLYTDASGKHRIEYWTLHGAGHTWSGGDASGSHTDVSGPDSAAEMVRFFLALF